MEDFVLLHAMPRSLSTKNPNPANHATLPAKSALARTIINAQLAMTDSYWMELHAPLDATPDSTYQLENALPAPRVVTPAQTVKFVPNVTAQHFFQAVLVSKLAQMDPSHRMDNARHAITLAPNAPIRQATSAVFVL